MPGQAMSDAGMREAGIRDGEGMSVVAAADNVASDISAAVAQAWRAVLDRTSLADDQPFDVAGGDSLGFLRLIHLIEEELALGVPLTAVSLAHRPSDLVAAIRALTEDAPAETRIRRKVFLVPTAGGTGPGQAAFCAGCAGDLDIEPLRLPHWTNIVDPSFRFASICTWVAEQVKAKCGDEPIHLVGYCFGGAIASVVARMLHREGYRVAFVGIIDGDVEWFRRPAGQRQERTAVDASALKVFPWAWHRLERFYLTWRQGRATENLARTVAELLELCDRRLLRWAVNRNLHRRLPEKFHFFLNLYLQMILLPRLDRPAFRQAMRADRPVPVPIAVFRTRLHQAGRPDDLGWSELFHPVRVSVVDGDHESVFTPAMLDVLCQEFVRAIGDLTGTDAGATRRQEDRAAEPATCAEA